MDNLDYLIALSLNPIADETAKEFENIDDSGVVISKKTDRRIRKLIRKSAKCSREETAVVTRMTVPDKIEEIRKPRLLPQGVVESVVDENFRQFSCDYYMDTTLVMAFSQKLLTKKTNLINGEDAEVSYISVNDNEAVLVRNKNGNVVLDWTDGEYEYTIVGYGIGADIILLMAESVG